MKCYICESEKFSGHCCLRCLTQYCLTCEKITYSIDEYPEDMECQCLTYDTVDERLHLTIGYLEQIFSGLVSSFSAVFGVDLVEMCLHGILENIENIRGRHLHMSDQLLKSDAPLGMKLIALRQGRANEPLEKREEKPS